MLRRGIAAAVIFFVMTPFEGLSVEGMKVLEDRDLYGIVSEACDKCIKRAYELG